MTDEDQSAYRRRRKAEILAYVEENGDRFRSVKGQPVSGDGIDPETKGGGWLGSAVGVIVVLAASWLVMTTAMTIARFTGGDFAAARRKGTATVEQCDRRGPVSMEGFGYWKECTVSITLDGSAGSFATISQPGFFKDEKPGDTFQIGEDLVRQPPLAV